MAIEHTLSIIKPDATKRNISGKIVDRLEASGLRVVAQKRITMNAKQAGEFYQQLADKPFYPSLVQFMTSGPCVVQVLSGENAVVLNRTIMGATNPAEALTGTIRADFAESIEANCVHGSDSAENAAKEISFFFSRAELLD